MPLNKEINTQDIIDLLKAVDELTNAMPGFASSKKALERIFQITMSPSQQDIFIRLTVIDSMYSTQMNKRYYGLEELSEAIYNCNYKKENLSEAFKQFAKPPQGNDLSNLFLRCYGLDQNGDRKKKAVSLLSKYACIETGYNFPIYDSLIREWLPVLWDYCGFGEFPFKMPNNDIKEFICAVNKILSKLGLENEPRKYEMLDRLLWTIGKINKQSYSLILSREQIEALHTKTKTKHKNLSEIFSEQPILQKLNHLAKELNNFKEL